MGVWGILPLLFQQSVPFSVDVPNRLALTPIIDGQIEYEEWDPLSDMLGIQSFLQWEPGALYLAGRAQKGTPILVNVDAEGDGWLKGSDNFEFLINNTPEGLKFLARRLSADGKEVKWLELEHQDLRIQMASKVEGNTWSFEMKLLDGVIPHFSDRREIGVRFEPGRFDVGVNERQLSTVRLLTERSFGLIDGIEWNPEMPVRSVMPGESTKLRFTLWNQTKWLPVRVESRSLGLALPFTAMQNTPFSGFDSKGRTFVDYFARILDNSSLGYRVANVRFIGTDGQDITLQASYQIAPLLSITNELPIITVDPNGGFNCKIRTYVTSNGRPSFKGDLCIVAPDTWQIDRNNRKVYMYHTRGSQKEDFNIQVPAGTSGEVPIQIQMSLGKEQFTRTVFLRFP